MQLWKKLFSVPCLWHNHLLFTRIINNGFNRNNVAVTTRCYQIHRHTNTIIPVSHQHSCIKLNTTLAQILISDRGKNNELKRDNMTSDRIYSSWVMVSQICWKARWLTLCPWPWTCLRTRGERYGFQDFPLHTLPLPGCRDQHYGLRPLKQ